MNMMHLCRTIVSSACILQRPQCPDNAFGRSFYPTFDDFYHVETNS